MYLDPPIGRRPPIGVVPCPANRDHPWKCNTDHQRHRAIHHGWSIRRHTMWVNSSTGNGLLHCELQHEAITEPFLIYHQWDPSWQPRYPRAISNDITQPAITKISLTLTSKIPLKSLRGRWVIRNGGNNHKAWKKYTVSIAKIVQNGPWFW